MRFNTPIATSIQQSSAQSNVVFFMLSKNSFSLFHLSACMSFTVACIFAFSTYFSSSIFGKSKTLFRVKFLCPWPRALRSGTTDHSSPLYSDALPSEVLKYACWPYRVSLAQISDSAPGSIGQELCDVCSLHYAASWIYAI